MSEFDMRQFELENQFDGFSVFKFFVSISIVIGLFVYFLYMYC